MGRSKQEIKYVYAVKSAAFPGLIKIGRTQHMKERLSQLNTSCTPSPFVIVAVSQTVDYVRDEKLAHDFFSLQRREGEFFSVSESEVIDFLKTIQEKCDVESSQPRVVDPESESRNAQFQSLLRQIGYGNLMKDKPAKDMNISHTSHAELESLHLQMPVEPALDDFSRKRKREQDDVLFDMDMAERKMELEERKMELEERKRTHNMKLIEHIMTSMRTISEIMDMHNVDVCTKMQAKDFIKHVLFNKMAGDSEYQSSAKYNSDEC